MDNDEVRPRLQVYWYAAGTAFIVSVGAIFAQRRQENRRDPDRIGIISWPLVQVLALIATFILAVLALHAP